MAAIYKAANKTGKVDGGRLVLDDCIEKKDIYR